MPGKGDDVAFFWLSEVDTKTFEELGHSGQLPTLDAKLASALLQIAPRAGELGKNISVREETMASQRTRLRGRHILRLIYDHHKLDEDNDCLYSIEDVLAVELKNDDVAGFLARWDHGPSP